MLKLVRSWKKSKKAALAFLLALCLTLNSLPLTVFATDTDTESTASVESVELTEESAEAEESTAAGEDETEETTEDAADTTTKESTDTAAGITLSSASTTANEEEETTDMPAVTLSGTESGITVTVAAPDGAFPKDVEMVLSAADEEEFSEAVMTDFEENYSSETYTILDQYAVEISFYVDGEEVEPAKDVTVTISGLSLATKADGLEADYALVYHVDDNGSAEYIEANDETPGQDSYTFTASSFSAYGVVNVNVEYGVSAASTLNYSTDTITYSYTTQGSHGQSSTTTTTNITVHFVDSSGNELDNATITFDDENGITSYSGTVALSTLASYYTVTVNGETYYYRSALVATSASYSAGNAAQQFRYSSDDWSSAWQYSNATSGNNNWSNLSSAITNIYLIYTDVEYASYSGNTVDHIDLAIYPTASLTINGETLTTTITLTNSDFYNSDGSSTGTWGLVAFDDEEKYYNYSISGMNASGSSDSSGNAQVRFEGTFPIGTNSDKIYYTFWFTTSVTFTDEDTDESYTVEMTFYNTFTYYSTDNKCPGLGNSWNGTTYAGSSSGMDFTLSAQMSGGSIQIVKEVRDATTSDLLDLTTDVTYTILLYSKTETNDVVEETASLTVSDGMATTLYSLGAGNYYVKESSPAASVTTEDGDLDYVKTETYYVTTTYDASGNVTKTSKSTSVESLTSGDVEVDSYTSVTFCVVNYYGKETVDVPVEKVWKDENDYYKLRPESVTVYLYANGVLVTEDDGETPVSLTLSDSNSWTGTFEGLSKYDDDDKEITYTVAEAGNLNSAYTSKVTGDMTNGYTITNTLETANITVAKILLDSEGEEVTDSTENDDNFTMRLYTYDGSDYNEVESQTLTLTTGSMSYTFSDLPLGTYYLSEELAGSNLHAYTVTVKVGSETVAANEDGYYEIVLNTLDATVAVEVTNKVEPITYDITADISGTKTLTDGDELADDQSITFYYYVSDEDENQVTTGYATVTNSNYENVAITFSPVTVTYTEAGTYKYVIRESSLSSGGVTYDSARYDLTVVVELVDGALTVTSTTLTKTTTDSDTGDTTTVNADSVDFTNIYDTGSASLTLRAKKSFEGTLVENQFTLAIQGYTDSTFETENDYYVESKNGSAGYFGDTITFTEPGTYYYTVSEKKGSETGVTYDTTVYYITVTVETVDHVLTVTAVTYYTDTDSTETSLIEQTLVYSEDSNSSYTVTTLKDLTFSNGYEAEGTAELSVIKVLVGRDFVEGETFTFLVTAENSGSPVLSAINDNNSVSITDNGDETYTVTVTVASSGTESVDGSNYSLSWVLGQLVLDESHIGNSYTYEVKETSASNDNGMTLDTYGYGHLITVTVVDEGNGELSATVVSTNDEDWDGDETTVTDAAVVVNEFSQGNIQVAGSKNWVDGGLEHTAETNADNVLLKLYRTTDTTINSETEWELVTTDGTDATIVNENDYVTTVVWTSATDWVISNLPQYDISGNAYTYKVVEETIEGYIATYGNYDTNSSYINTAITNTVTQEYITLSGTKTWVDGGLTHDNSTDVTLIVTRTSTGIGETTLTEVTGNGTGIDGTYIVVWNDDDGDDVAETYHIYWYYDEDAETYVGLPVYDNYGYTYMYTVKEADEYGDNVGDGGSIIVGDYNYTVTYDEDGNITNTRVNDDETEPHKTETGYGEGSVDEDSNTITYDTVSVGDIITYVISYYNNYNTVTTITITDELDDGVTFVSASDEGKVTDEEYAVVVDDDGNAVYNNDGSVAVYLYGGTVTWTLEVQPFYEGTVTLQVKVNANAKTTDEGEDTATVENQATVQVGTDNAVDTEIVVNPIDPDEPSTPTKVVSASSATGVNGASVKEGDLITYTISYYNHTASAAVVTIKDTLDKGVDFVSATESSTISSSYNKLTRTVTWTITDVSAFTGGTVDLTVKVNSSATTQVENDATVIVGDNEATTNLVVNPVPEEEEETPEEPDDTDDTETTVSELVEEAVVAVTGDNAPIGLAILIAVVSEFTLLILIYLQMRKKKDDVN